MASGLVARLAEALSGAGLDIVQPLALAWYNEVAPPEARIRGTPDSLVVLFGNSKLVWEPFLAACAKDEGLLASEHPFNTYVERALGACLQECAASQPHRVYWSHKRAEDLDGHFVAMQRMAHAGGLAFLDDASHLSLHPKFGSWFSLRCAVVFDGLAWTEPRPAAPADPLCPQTRRYVALAMSTAIHCAERRCQRVEDLLRRRSCDVGPGSRPAAAAAAELLRRRSHDGRASGGFALRAASAPPPGRTAAAALLAAAPALAEGSTGNDGGDGMCCDPSSPRAVTESSGGDSACSSRRASEDSVRAEGAEAEEPTPPGEFEFAVHEKHVKHPTLPSMTAVRSTWRKWVAVRDAPCPGHAFRYSEEQIAYHYTAERAVLLAALQRRGLLPARAVCSSRTPPVLLPAAGPVVSSP